MRPIIVAILALILIAPNLHAQTLKESEWKGFKRYDFTFQDRAARLVVPTVALPGNPWVWRARFPDYHSEIDSMLAAKGFHIAFINTNNLYGSPAAVAVWDQFYSYLVEAFQLKYKVALSGHSRGGLFVHNWAKQNPRKVACIYADAPVCDFKSWPGGLGAGAGSAADWERLQQVYGFASEAEAKAYRDNPIDQLEPLVAAGVPILHTISLQDKIVPPEENSLLLINRYIRLGGAATVMPCSKGKQALEGHHYSIDDPAAVVEFFTFHSLRSNPALSSHRYHTLRKGLGNALHKFKTEKKGQVAFLGGSITYNPGWRDSICHYLSRRFPDTEFEFIAVGIPSTGTTPGAFRLQRDVLSKGKIDLLFEEAAVNDATNGRSRQEQIRAMEGIVRATRKNNPLVDIVMMHFVDPDKMASYRAGEVPEVIQHHNLVAEHYDIPTIDLAKEVTARIDNGEFSWANDFINLHPSPFGQQVYAHSMKAFLENAFASASGDRVGAQPASLPAPLDPYNYQDGHLVQINKARGRAWTIDPNWVPQDGARVRPNYHSVPMLISEKPGGRLRFSFEGTAVGMAVAAGPDAGIITYRIDRGPWQNLNLYTKWSGQLHLPWYYTLAAELEPKKHLLEVKIADEKDERSQGYACRIRYFFVNGER